MCTFFWGTLETDSLYIFMREISFTGWTYSHIYFLLQSREHENICPGKLQMQLSSGHMLITAGSLHNKAWIFLIGLLAANISKKLFSCQRLMRWLRHLFEKERNEANVRISCVKYLHVGFELVKRSRAFNRSNQTAQHQHDTRWPQWHWHCNFSFYLVLTKLIFQ